MFGGLFSLMTGASIISIAEYIYYQTGKCFTIFFTNSNKKKTKIDKQQKEEQEKIKKTYWNYVYDDLEAYTPKFGKFYNIFNFSERKENI